VLIRMNCNVIILVSV